MCCAVTTLISTQTHALASSRRKVGTVIRVDNEPKTARLHVTLSVIQVGKVPHNKSRALLHCRWRRNSGGSTRSRPRRLVRARIFLWQVSLTIVSRAAGAPGHVIEFLFCWIDDECPAIMATLTRLRPPAATTQLNVLHDTVPAPFPVDLFQQQARQQQVEPCPAPQQTSARPTLLEASSLGKDVHILTEGLNSVVETQMCLSREVNVSPSMLRSTSPDLTSGFRTNFCHHFPTSNNPV